jgi:acetoin utilization deacetylase AcuC-like enzyme
MATGFLFDPRYLDHDTGPGHPECPERLTESLKYLKAQPWFSGLTAVSPRSAEPEWIQTVHGITYMKHALEICKSGQPFLDTPDVGVSENTFEIALLAAGGVLELADKVMKKEIRNGFALLRPPGHHAERDFAMGFCLFNNAAVTARYLQKKHGLDKIAILDWDVHHGNGTQHAFEEDASVLYISLHQYPFYPGTGSAWETGAGRGKGATLNCPMEAGSGNREYETAFTEKIIPKLKEFKPQAVVISAGFDAHERDPLARMGLTTEFFGWMTERVMEIAGQYSEGRIVSLLEGGYNLRELPGCIGAHLKKLGGFQGKKPG